MPSRRSRSRSSSRSRSASASSSRSSVGSSSSRSPSPSGPDSSRPAVAGPQLPSDFIRSRPSSHSISASDDDEDGPSVGPALPSATTRDDGLNDGARLFLEREARKNAAEREAKLAAEKAANSRPEWMLLPPSLSNASSLQAVAGDPLNLKSRGFAQSTPRVSARGGGAAAAEDADTSLWTETPEQRLQRMQDEVSGVKARGSSSVTDHEALERERSAQRDASIAASVAEARGKKSLVEEHNERRKKEMQDKLEDEAREERRRREKRRRREDDKEDSRSSRHRHSRSGDHHRRRRSKSRSRSPDARDRHSTSSSSHRHRSSRHGDSHRSHGSRSSHRHSDSSDDERRRERRRRKDSERRRDRDDRKERAKDKDKGKDEEKDRKRKLTRKEREEEEVRLGKVAAPMIWDRDAALSIGGRLMDEKKRGKMLADANALGDRFGSGSRRFL